MYRFRTLTLSECVQMFAASPLPHGPVNTIAEAFAHEQIQYNKLIKTMPHPTAGSIRVVGGCARAHKTLVWCRSSRALLARRVSCTLTSATAR
jgi:crotonobetainyl-CoA:carnitine CoA-transferase CaiB-like acyl-CoA transferase